MKVFAGVFSVLALLSAATVSADGLRSAQGSRALNVGLGATTSRMAQGSALFDEACQAHLDAEFAKIDGYNAANAEVPEDEAAQKAFACKYGPKVKDVYEAAKNNPKCAGEDNADGLEFAVKLHKLSISLAECGGASVGVIIGAVISVLVLVGLVVCCVKKRKN
jgi:hypothetical protein